MISHTTDYRRVKRITDANPMEADNPWRLTISREIYYLIEVQENCKDVGVWAFEPHDGGYCMHTAMTRDCRGRKAVRSGLDAIGWLFNHTVAQAVYAAIPEHLKHAHTIPIAAGLKPLGIRDNMRQYIMTRETFLKKAA